jgi:hypothetical protein
VTESLVEIIADQTTETEIETEIAAVIETMIAIETEKETEIETETEITEAETIGRRRAAAKKTTAHCPKSIAYTREG